MLGRETDKQRGSEEWLFEPSFKYGICLGYSGLPCSENKYMNICHNCLLSSSRAFLLIGSFFIHI
jgi:hypothetical protein